MKRRYIKSHAWLLVCLCIFGCLLPGMPVLAAQEEPRAVRIGYTDYDNFIVPKEQGEGCTGYGAEYLERIAEYTGWRYEYVYGSWEDNLKKLESGEIDFVCHAQRTGEREARYLFSKYAIGLESSVIYAEADDDRYYYNDFAAFDGMRVAMLKDSYQSVELADYAEQNGFSFSTELFGTQTECFDALSAGEVDAVVTGGLADRADYKVICRFGATPFYFMSGRENEALMAQLDAALGQIAVAGSSFQEELYQKYYGSPEWGQDMTLTREEARFIEESGAIKVAFIPGRKPFSYLNEEGEAAGITVDILDRMQEQTGLRFSYQVMPAGMRTDEYLAEHPDALIAGIMTQNPAFEAEEYIVSDSFYADDVALACLRGKEYELNADGPQYKLAIPRSYMALEKYIQEHYPRFDIIGCTTMEECFELVQEGKADFLAQNVNVITPYLANPHYENFTVVPTFFMEETTGIVALRTDQSELLFGILNKSIATITQTELSQYTVDQMLANQYRLTFGDMAYRFRYAFLVIAVLVALIVGMFGMYVRQRHLTFQRLEKKNAQLMDAVAQANNANQAKSAFLARMSHEIRTPMNAVVGLTELARHHEEEPEQIDAYLNKIDTSSRILLNIINDILDMSAIESNKIRIDKQPFSLRELLVSIETVYSAQCRQRDVTFSLDMTGVPEGQIVGDSLRLNQVLLNLISNACKFTPEHGQVRVMAKEMQDQGKETYYQFSVEDTGEGMSREMLDRLFLPFEQEGSETARRHGGSGLGLSIAKNLVELMGGSITCQSKKGLGTVFTVSLPFGTSGPKGGEGQPAGKEAKDYDFQGKKVLLAEDTVMNADILTELLSLVKLEVEHAWNGKEAVRMFTESEPGTYLAILMDVQMPEMDGYEAAAAIRASGHPQAGIPIYAMTANAFTEDVSAALNAGMDGHIAKPVDIRRLYELLDSLVRRDG